MRAGPMHYAISANRLRDGIVVFLGAGGAWVEQLAQAAAYPEKEQAEAALEGARGDEKRNLVVEAFVFPVRQSPAGLVADHIRDAIRAAGPSVYRDHGKQAETR
ncbi:MAG: hypothetical protein JWN93_219 [Hyphomicrobiales bacterium]|nr:hypothetical protein [Hyphomicrobiales bacterium]